MKREEVEVMKRPVLNNSVSIEDFKGYYWSKEELVKFCRGIGLNANGGKIEITERIELFLATARFVSTVEKVIPTSRFDWKHAELNINTIITDNYKNTENVRAFMTLQIGQHFRFNVDFMNWIKSNVGKNMYDAIEEWNRIYIRRKNKEYKSEIAPQFEYNRYIRDFMLDNLGASLKDVIKCWKIKRAKIGG
jgi:hypothetical protein